MAKRTTRSTSKGMTNLVLCGQAIDVAYHVPHVQPAAPGPWQNEADKIAWTDRKTGYPCIIRREQDGGHLAFYVCLPRSHPLNGWAADAIPPSLVDVAGGLDYSALCDEDGPEDRSICHVSTDSAHYGDLWWLGACCNRITDIVPDDKQHAERAREQGIAQEYRDVRELYARCTQLASNLRDLENGDGR